MKQAANGVLYTLVGMVGGATIGAILGVLYIIRKESNG